MSGFDGGITEMLMESNQSGFYPQIYRELQVHQQWFEKKSPKTSRIAIWYITLIGPLKIRASEFEKMGLAIWNSLYS
jgi:hypothetical protein